MKNGKKTEKLTILGLHSVAQALSGGKQKHGELFITKGAALALKKRGLRLPGCVKVRIVSPRDVDALAPGTVHQGVVLVTSPENYLSSLDQVVTGETVVVVLDQVTDPHNVGAVMRSCAVFGVRALVLTQRRSPAISTSGALAKAASGAMEHVKLVPVVNLSRALQTMHESGFEIVGFAQEADACLGPGSLPEKCVLVFGSENRGLRRLTRERCSKLLSIPAEGTFSSLNVSNAVAVSLYAHRLFLSGRSNFGVYDCKSSGRI